MTQEAGPSETNPNVVSESPLAAADNVLLLAPTGDEHAGYADLLAASGESVESLRAIAFDRCSDEWLSTWRREVGRDLPRETTVVDVAEQARGATAAGAGGATEITCGPVTIRSVADPTDLGAVGDAIVGGLASADEERGRTVVGVHSLSTLLATAGEAASFRFLHLLTRRVATADATGLYYLDPSEVDATCVRTLAALFDAILERDGEEWVPRE